MIVYLYKMIFEAPMVHSFDLQSYLNYTPIAFKLPITLTLTQSRSCTQNGPMGIKYLNLKRSEGIIV